MDDLLQGPTAVAFVNGDPVEAAKGLRDFAKANPALVVKGGVMDGKALTADEVRKLADLESREVLLGKLAGGMLATLSKAVYLLNAPLAQAARLAGALQPKATEDPSIIGGAGTPPPLPRPRPRSRARRPAEATAADAPLPRRPTRHAAPEATPPRTPRPRTPRTEDATHRLTGSGRRTTPPHRRRNRHTDQKETPPWRSSAPTSSSTRSRR